MKETIIADFNGTTVKSNMEAQICIENKEGKFSVSESGTPITFVICEKAKATLLSYEAIAQLKLTVTGGKGNGVHDVRVSEQGQINKVTVTFPQRHTPPEQIQKSNVAEFYEMSDNDDSTCDDECEELLSTEISVKEHGREGTTRISRYLVDYEVYVVGNGDDLTTPLLTLSKRDVQHINAILPFLCIKLHNSMTTGRDRGITCSAL